MTTKIQMRGQLILILLTIISSLLFAKATKGDSPKSNFADPPYEGTIFLDPDIITSADDTTFQGATYTGQGMRLMFDRRVNDWIYVNAYLFYASFSDGLTAEIQVNPEFNSSSTAEVVALKYGEVIGRLPTVLRKDVQTVWIHMGNQLFGGGNNNLLIHTEQGDSYEASGILEEAFVYEASHTSLDATHSAAPGWLAAQTADGNYISTYARDYPTREDIAESFLMYLAVRYRSDRISQADYDIIMQTIPNRITYFDNHVFDVYPSMSVVFLPLICNTCNSQPLQQWGVRPGDYTTYNFTDGDPFYNLDMYSTWEVAPSEGYIYPAFQFYFEANEAGYIGMQLDGTTKKAIFSIWDIADGSAQPASSWCGRFGGEGTGAQCLISYDWIKGREYRLRIWVLSNDEHGETWIGAIQDTVSGVETEIGEIYLNNSNGYVGYGWLRNDPLTFLEYFYGEDGCEGNPYSRIKWRGPYANANTYTANSAVVPFYPNCTHNNVTTPGRPFVVHEGGGTTTITTLPGTVLWTAP